VSIINPLARELAAKIVYYGPGLSGKTTSLQRIHAAVKPESRGELISLATEGDRTLFFDFLPLKVEQIRGLSIRLQLYTVPGQVYYDATRKLVLNGADGVVFVADSQDAARDANLESMQNLATNLSELGIEPERFPLVLQYNKRDLPSAMPVARLRADLNPRGAPDFETVAQRGQGIFNALKQISKLVIRELKARQAAAPTVTAPVDFGDSEGTDDLSKQISAAAEAQAAPSVPSPADAAELRGVSYAALVPAARTLIIAAEHAIQEQTYGEAVRAAATALASLLDTLPAADQGHAAKAALLGMDGRDYLRLCRLAGQPDVALGEREALFALHVLVDAHLKAEGI
jgi:signal recognition particle receptor subunit beta